MISDTRLIDSWKFGSFINHYLGQFSDFAPICYHISHQFYSLLHILSAHLFFPWCLFHPGWQDNIYLFIYLFFLPAKILQDEERRALLKAGAGEMRENSHHKNLTFYSPLPSGNWRPVSCLGDKTCPSIMVGQINFYSSSKFLAKGSVEEANWKELFAFRSWQGEGWDLCESAMGLRVALTEERFSKKHWDFQRTVGVGVETVKEFFRGAPHKSLRLSSPFLHSSGDKDFSSPPGSWQSLPFLTRTDLVSLFPFQTSGGEKGRWRLWST